MHSQRIRYVLWESEHKIMHFGKARTRMTLAKAIAATIGFLTSSYQAIPDAIVRAAWVLLLFLIIDLFATNRANRVCKEAETRSETERFVTKTTQYIVIICLCIGGAVIGQNLYFVRVGLIGLGAIESIEMLRQLARLEKCGGVNIRPIRPLLQIVGQLFLDREDKPKGE